MADHAGMAWCQLGRAVAGAVAIVPGLSEMIRQVADGRAVHRLGEGDQEAVFMDMQRLRELNGSSGVADALKTAVVGRVISPSAHPGDIELAVARVRFATMDAGAEFARQRDDRSLRLPGDFVAKHQKLAPLAEGKVHDLPGERAEAEIVHDGLRAAAVVES